MKKLILLLVLWPMWASADPTPAELRQTCAAAMNANPGFADEIVKTINEKTAFKHAQAADEIAMNERHVILAYAAMWLVAAAFVIFLWRRQRALESEIVHLRRELDAAAGEGNKART